MAPIVQGSGYRQRVTHPPLGWDEPTAAQDEAFREREERHEAAEERRLLYVAATRAQELLVVSTYPEKPNDGPWAPLYAHLDAADVSELEEPTLEAPKDRELAPAPSLEEQRAERHTRIQEGAQPSYRAESVTEATPEGPEGTLYPESEQDGYGEEFGTALHVLLDQCVRMRTDESSITDTVVRAVLEQEGAVATPVQVRRAGAMIERFLDSPIWADLQDADPVYTEYPLAHEVLDSPIPVVRRGVIDLAYRREGAWVLVDYKSDQVRKDTLETLSDDHPYAQQIRTYADSWAAVVGEPVRRAGLWFADVGAHIVVVQSATEL